jgi:DNA invertase Pin-like site-specific DNA recombinase
MIALQRAACERSAKELGAHIIREYVEYGGTGNIDTRFVIRRMLNELHARRDTTYLIVTKKDRLARQPHDQFRLTQEIHAAGVELVTTDHSPTPWQFIQ